MILFDHLKSEAQRALDELFNEGELPFKLTVYRVLQEATDFYVVYFQEGRLNSITLYREEHESFKERVRDAILLKVSGLKNLSMED